MNLRRQRPNDSLDMLLDTMCNTFGGIIMLAVLVVLLTSKERQGHSGTSSDTHEMLQRRLAFAETNLQQSLQLTASLQAKADDERWKQQIDLTSTRKELQGAIQQAREAVAQNNKELEAASTTDPSERLKFLNAEFATAQARKLEVKNSLAAATENTKRLKQRLADMERQVAAKLNESQRPLRLPKEYQTGKRVIYLIACYGRIYPCRNADFSRNETDINWTTVSRSEIAKPIQSKGIDPLSNPRELENYFNRQSKDLVYVVFCVFEDSFPAFIRAKQSAVARSLAYGWEPFRNQDGPISFGENGHTPKPQ